MATLKQKRAVEKLVGNGGNVTRAMIDAGYSPNTANTPQKLTTSEGYKATLAEYGLTEGLITKALVSDIKKKPKRRVRELELAADILAMRNKNSHRRARRDIQEQAHAPHRDTLRRIAVICVGAGITNCRCALKTGLPGLRI